MSEQVIYLVEVTAATPGTGVNLTTLYYSSTPGYVSGPGESPANTVYETRLIDPGSFSQFLFGPQRLRGSSEVGVGSVVLNNADGGLDALVTYAFDGRSLKIKRGAVGDNLAAYTTVFSGTVEQALFEWSTITLVLRDEQARVASLPITENRYAGDNFTSGSTEVEGTEDDLKGKFEPRLYGSVEGISPPLVNTADLTYQISDQAIDSVDKVYDNGAELTAGTSHGSLSALLAASVGAGEYDEFLGSTSEGAYIRLGSSPAGIITVDAAEGATSPNERTAAQIASRILYGPGGLASGELDATSVTTLDSANAAEVGIWVGTDGASIGEVLDQVLGSVGGYWVANRTGTFEVGRLELPTGTAVITLEDWQVLEDIERVRVADQGGGIPAWRIELLYRKNYTVLRPADVADVASLARQNVVTTEWRAVTASDTDTQAQHPLAPEKQIETLLTTEADADTEVARLLTIFGGFIEMLRVPLAIEYAEDISLGDVVELDLSRYNLNNVKFRVTGAVEEYEAGVVTFEMFRVLD